MPACFMSPLTPDLEVIAVSSHVARLTPAEHGPCLLQRQLAYSKRLILHWVHSSPRLGNCMLPTRSESRGSALIDIPRGSYMPAIPTHSNQSMLTIQLLAAVSIASIL